MKCKDAGAIQTPSGVIRLCPDCVDYAKHSRLTVQERDLTIDSIRNRRKDDASGQLILLRFLAKSMLDDPYGFLTVVGGPGTAKSLVLTALIAEFCKTGKRSMYYTGPDIAKLYNPYDGDPAASDQHFKAIPVLAIDEMDKVKWSEWNIEMIGNMIDHRYRNQESKVTLFAMNAPPEQWSNADRLTYLASRLRDGRFGRRWPEHLMDALPAAANGDPFIPGYINLDMPDLRPALRR